MNKTLALLAATALATGLTFGSAQAQLIGGGVTGGLGGAVGPVGGSISGSGGLGVGGLGVDRTVRDVRQSTRRVVRDARRTVVTAVPAVPSVSLNAVDIRRRDALITSGVTLIAPSQVDVYMDRQIIDLRQELDGSGVDVVRRGEQIVLVLPSDVTFAFDKADLQPRFRPVLDRVAGTLNHYPSTLVDVTGHADAIGSDAYNQALSERRASTVSGYLAARGALAQRLQSEGVGESEPVASNASIQGRAANRRVEIALRPVVQGG